MTLCLSHLCFINIYNFIMNIYILFNMFIVLLRLLCYCVYGVNDNADVFTTPLLKIAILEYPILLSMLNNGA